MAHGTYNKNYKVYNLIIEKCQEDTINYILGENSHCKNFSELEEIYANFSYYGVVSFYFINHYIDALDYENPDVKFFYNVEGILNKEQYSVNNLNFNPSLVKTHNGLIFDNVIEEKGFIYERNDVSIKQSEGNEIFIAFILWPHNTVHYHERIYKKILDIISSIGGISQFVTIVAIYINSLYHNFIILIDTQYLLNSSIETEKNKNIENKKINKIKDIEKEKLKKDFKIVMIK